MIGAISGIGGVSPYQGMMGLRTNGNEAVQPVSQQETQMQLRLSGEGTTPVQPVDRVRPLGAPTAHTPEGVDLAQKIQQGQYMDPAEFAVRLRMQGTNAENPALTQMGDEVQSAQEIMEEGECQTCAERKYQDGSDDSGVSYQTPMHIAPEAAASAVHGHEMERVVRNQAEAAREDREIVSQSVTLHTAICPECGKVYISGGTTRMTTAAKAESAANRPGECFSAVA